MLPGDMPEGAPEQPWSWLDLDCADPSRTAESQYRTSLASSLPVKTQSALHILEQSHGGSVMHHK